MRNNKSRKEMDNIINLTLKLNSEYIDTYESFKDFLFKSKIRNIEYDTLKALNNVNLYYIINDLKEKNYERPFQFYILSKVLYPKLKYFNLESFFLNRKQHVRGTAVHLPFVIYDENFENEIDSQVIKKSFFKNAKKICKNIIEIVESDENFQSNFIIHYNFNYFENSYNFNGTLNELALLLFFYNNDKKISDKLLFDLTKSKIRFNNSKEYKTSSLKTEYNKIKQDSHNIVLSDKNKDNVKFITSVLND